MIVLFYIIILLQCHEDSEYVLSFEIGQWEGGFYKTWTDRQTDGQTHPVPYSNINYTHWEKLNKNDSFKQVIGIKVNWRISTGILKRIARASIVKIPVEIRQFFLTNILFKSVVFVAECFSVQRGIFEVIQKQQWSDL